MNIKSFFKQLISSTRVVSINQCNVNERSYAITGNNVSITNGKVIVDGVEINPGADKRFAITQVIVNAEKVESLKVDCAGITVNGSVHGNVDVDCGNINIEGDLIGEARVDCGNIKVKGLKLPKGPELESLKENVSIFGKTLSRDGVSDRHGKSFGHTI